MASSNPTPHPWEEHYPPHAREKFIAPEGSVYHLFEEAAQKYSARPCLNFLGNRYTYAEVQAQINRVAEGLHQWGFGLGDKIALCLPNCPYYVFAYYGALKIGATVVNVNPLYTKDEMAHILKDSGAKAVFTLDLKTLYPKLATLCENKNTALNHIFVCPLADTLPPLKRVLFTLFKRKERANITPNNTTVLWKTLCANEGKTSPARLNPKEDIALLQYTGGTTGVPKGAALTHANVVANAAQVRCWLGHPSKPDKFVAVIPFFHVFSMTACLNLPLSSGAEIIMLPRFEMKALLHILTKQRPTIFPGVPSLFQKINDFPNIEKHTLSSLRFCISGGAGLPMATRIRFEKLTKCPLVEGYGLTEASPVLACNPPHLAPKANSIGLPLPGTVLSIRDPENIKKELPTGETGELCAKGPQIMTHYWENKKATADTLQNGWLKTGDMGTCDESGYFYITDRIKDIILVNGFNVYPRAVENALYRNKNVSEALVIGVPDAKKGEVPKAFVVLKEGATASKNDIMMKANEHLNPLERVSEVVIQKTLPKTLIGKLCRKTLKEQETA